MKYMKSKKTKISEKPNISGFSKRGKRNRNRGHTYERKLISELKQITQNQNLCSSRLASKQLDDAKIDVFDPDNVLPFYVQAKSTQQIPQIKKINDTVGKNDKPLVIFWNAQEMREARQVSVGEYCIVPKNLFYNLLELLYAR